MGGAPAADAAQERLGPELRSLVHTYVGYLSGCDECTLHSLRDAQRADGEASRLRLLLTWRRAPSRTYTRRERVALVWAEAVAVAGEAGIGEALRREGGEVFTPDELTALTRMVTSARGWKRLMLQRSVPARRRGRDRREAVCPETRACELCASY